VPELTLIHIGLSSISPSEHDAKALEYLWRYLDPRIT
jgi:hypothetical protein